MNDETLERVYDLLDKLPANTAGLTDATVAIEHLIELLVLLDERHY
jgi:hypothetical protein